MDDEVKRKQFIQQTFDTVATGYDSPALRFFNRAAAHLPGIFEFAGDEAVLDVATGTAEPALALAPHLPRGTVTGVDFSEGMLERARAKAEAQGIRNADFQRMDMTAMSLPDGRFDAANCSFGVFFVEDMAGLLRHIATKLKPGGRIVTTSFSDDAFLPLTELFFERIRGYGVEPPDLSWQRVGTEDKYRALYETAGLQDIRIHRRDVGYHLKDAGEWWDIVWYAGFRGMVNQLEPDDLARFKQEHLADIQSQATEEGIRLHVEVLYAEGVVKG